MCGHECFAGKPLLVLANKQDLSHAVGAAELAEALRLHDLSSSPYQIAAGVANTELKEGSELHSAIGRLLQTVAAGRGELQERIERQQAEAKERDRKRKEERRARLEAKRKAREEAEAEAERAKGPGEDGEAQPPANGVEPERSPTEVVEQCETQAATVHAPSAAPPSTAPLKEGNPMPGPLPPLARKSSPSHMQLPPLAPISQRGALQPIANQPGP